MAAKNITIYGAAAMKKRPILTIQSLSTLDEDGYVFGKEMGRGAFGIVRELICKDGRIVACKSMSKSSALVSFRQISNVRREIKAMSRLRKHENVIGLEAVYEDDDDVHLVMELCHGGELFKRIFDGGPFSEQNAALVFHQLMEAVAFIHDNGIIHRDLKLENILLFSCDPCCLKIKIIDFGMADYMEPGEYLYEAIGTPYYVSPEVLMRRYNCKADVWSCGVILYVMLVGELPFWGENDYKICHAVRFSELVFPSHALVSHEAKDLITKMLNRDANKRLSARQVLRHPWLLRASKNN